MGRHDWFRHTEWSSEIEEDSNSHLRRARDKVQPLKVQASILAETHPEVALRLLERYFESGDHLFLADAHQIRARARLSLGDIEGAAEAYSAVLSREAEFPGVKTNSYVEYPLFVAEYAVSERYADALQVLSAGEPDLVFPLHRFMWHAARALILSAQGDSHQGRVEARLALSAADQTFSGFRYHPTFVAVGESYPKLREQLRNLSA